MDSQRPDTGIRSGRGIEAEINFAGGVQPGDKLAICAVDGSEEAADDHFAVALDGTGINKVIDAGQTGEKVGAERAVQKKTCEITQGPAADRSE